VLSPTAEVILLTTIVQQPGIKLREVLALLREYRVEVTEAIFLNKNGFSYQKMALIVKQRNEDV